MKKHPLSDALRKRDCFEAADELDRMRGDMADYEKSYEFQVEVNHGLRRELAAEKECQEAFAKRIMGEERYGNSPCQAHPLQLVEEYLNENSKVGTTR
jgi:hypothetical protein